MRIALEDHRGVDGGEIVRLKRRPSVGGKQPVVEASLATSLQIFFSLFDRSN